MILTVVLIEEEVSMCSELLRQLFIILSGNGKNSHARMQNPAATTAAEYQKPVLKTHRQIRTQFPGRVYFFRSIALGHNSVLRTPQSATYFKYLGGK